MHCAHTIFAESLSHWFAKPALEWANCHATLSFILIALLLYSLILLWFMRVNVRRQLASCLAISFSLGLARVFDCKIEYISYCSSLWKSSLTQLFAFEIVIHSTPHNLWKQVYKNRLDKVWNLLHHQFQFDKTQRQAPLHNAVEWRHNGWTALLFSPAKKGNDI